MALNGGSLSDSMEWSPVSGKRSLLRIYAPMLIGAPVVFGAIVFEGELAVPLAVIVSIALFVVALTPRYLAWRFFLRRRSLCFTPVGVEVRRGTKCLFSMPYSRIGYVSWFAGSSFPEWRQGRLELGHLVITKVGGEPISAPPVMTLTALDRASASEFIEEACRAAKVDLRPL